MMAKISLDFTVRLPISRFFTPVLSSSALCIISAEQVEHFRSFPENGKTKEREREKTTGKTRWQRR